MVNVLVIAGYDQSAGAGVLSDVKTLEAHGVYGYAACTAMTFQNERAISRVEWFSLDDVLEQIDVCFSSTRFDWVKMGITPSLSIAEEIIIHLKRHNPSVRVVLDPVIKASSGYDFWVSGSSWERVAAECFLVTPNWEEIGWLYPGEDVMERCRFLTLGSGCAVYLKGGHHPELPGRDYLWSRGAVQTFDAISSAIYPKHGSGCVLSSSLTANLALGHSLVEAATFSKRYIEQFLISNKSLLGWHRR